MKTVTAICATLLGAGLLAGAPASADVRCLPAQEDAGICASLHFVGDRDRDRARAYREGYRDALRSRSARGNRSAPPGAVIIDDKEGFSESYDPRRGHSDRGLRRHYDRDDDWRHRYYDRDDDWRHSRRYYDPDDYYEQRLRRDDRGEVIDFATELLRGLSN